MAAGFSSFVFGFLDSLAAVDFSSFFRLLLLTVAPLAVDDFRDFFASRELFVSTSFLALALPLAVPLVFAANECKFEVDTLGAGLDVGGLLAADEDDAPVVEFVFVFASDLGMTVEFELKLLMRFFVVVVVVEAAGTS